MRYRRHDRARDLIVRRHTSLAREETDDVKEEPAEMYVFSEGPRDLIDPFCTRPGVREPADDFDSEEIPLRLDTGLAES